MGLFKRNKDKHAKQNKTATGAQQGNNTTSVLAVPQDNTSINRKRSWTPRRKKAVPTPTTAQSTIEPRSRKHDDVLDNLNVVATDDIEIVTSESQQALIAQREEIRQKLFDSKMQRSPTRRIRNTSDWDVSNASHEVLPNGQVVPYLISTSSYLTADQASLPLSAVSQSWDTDEDHDLVMRNSVDYAEQEIQPLELANRLQTSSSMLDATPLMTNRAKSLPEKVTPNESLDTSRSSSSMPIDEQIHKAQVEAFRNKGKSPLKGMPEDEATEYQKDEMKSPSVVSNKVRDDTHWTPEEMSKYDEESRFSSNPLDSTVDSTTYDDKSRSMAVLVPQAAATLVNAALQCSDDAVTKTMAKADTACGTKGVGTAEAEASARNERQPPTYLDEAATHKFLRRITKNGFVLLYLVQDEEDMWNGRTVTMTINKGDGFHQPRLEWITVAGGTISEVSTVAVELFEILSIDTDVPDMSDELCFFTITTESGDLYIFEANSMEERDRLVQGLRTLIARWCFHLVAGDVTATSELYDAWEAAAAASRDAAAPVEDASLPDLPNPHLTMNRVAHQLLDVV